MKLRAFDVLFRAAQRGYSVDEIRPCLTKHLGGEWYEVDVDHPSYPRVAKEEYRHQGSLRDAANRMLEELVQAGVLEPPKPGLGDMVKSWLSAIGITEERVSKAIGRPCGCSERAKKLNELGRRVGIG
jgi:hypothetical protein